MSDLVVVRCGDPARHVLIRVARTPRGLEAKLCADLKPQTAATLARAMDKFFRREERSRGKGQKWVTKPWEDVVRQADDVVTVFCRCQAWIEVDVARINSEVETALATGRTRTIRATFD